MRIFDFEPQFLAGQKTGQSFGDKKVQEVKQSFLGRRQYMVSQSQVPTHVAPAPCWGVGKESNLQELIIPPHHKWGH